MFKRNDTVPFTAPVVVFCDKRRFMGPNWLVLRRLYHNPFQLIVTVEAADEVEEEEGVLDGRPGTLGTPGTPGTLGTLGRARRPVSNETEASGGAVVTGDATGKGRAGGAAIKGRKGCGPKSLGPTGDRKGEGAQGAKKKLF